MRLAASIFFCVSVLPMTAGVATAASTAWVKNPNPGTTRSCYSLCAEKSMQPVLGGKTPQSTADNFLVCTAQIGTSATPGWQITGAFGNGCDASADGKGKAYPVQSCLCSDSHVEPAN